jgi:plastocyanin
LVLLGVTAACGEEDNTPVGSGTEVPVSLTDYHISLSKMDFAPGAYTFVVKNDGRDDHKLEIEGNGMSDKRTGTIKAGQTEKIAVTFKAGTYDMYCPVDGHKGKGMSLQVKVGAGAAAPANTGGGGSGGGGS